MSLLDAMNETVFVYPEVTVTDSDGNTVVRASESGTWTAARIWPLSSEESQQAGGVVTSQRFGMRLPRSFGQALGAQSKVVWNDKVYSVSGDPLRFNGSARTRRIQYVIERS